MKWHRTALLLAMPALLAAGVALATQDDSAPPLRPAPKPVPETSPSPAPEVTPSPEAARILAAAADTGRFLDLPAGALDALTQRLKEKNGRPLVVVQYGDSHTQAGILSRELRTAFAQGGVTSPGYVAPGLHHLGDARATTAGRWSASNWLKGDDAGSYGPLGASWVTYDPRARVHLTLKTPAPAGTTVTALYYRSPRHAPFRLIAGDAVLAEVMPAAKGEPDMHVLGHAKVTLPAGTTELDLAVAAPKAGPELRFFGFLVEVPGASVEWDAFGIQGASVDHPLNRGDSTIEEYLALRQPDLVVVWFGSNSLVAPNFDPSTYGKTFESFLARLKSAAPQAARIAIGPPDLARRGTSCPTLGGGTTTKLVKTGKQWKRVTSKKRLSEHERAILPTFICQPEETVTTRAGKPQYPIRSIQTAAQWASYLETCQNTTLPSVATCTDATRAASMRQGFAFFDTFAFMDGPGSIHRWACQQPPLARFDHVHLTVDGYATVAQGLWAALLAKLPESAGLRRMEPLPSSSVDATLEEVDASP